MHGDLMKIKAIGLGALAFFYEHMHVSNKVVHSYALHCHIFSINFVWVPLSSPPPLLPLFHISPSLTKILVYFGIKIKGDGVIGYSHRSYEMKKS